MEYLKVVGTLKDKGFIGFEFFDAFCPKCDTEVYNIPICIASLCPKCRSVIIPCGTCCDFIDCKQGASSLI